MKTMRHIILSPLLIFFLLISSELAFSQPSSCNAAIGMPPNGPEHYITIIWSAVNGATSYQLDYSTDGTTWTNSLYTGTATTFNHAASNQGNVPFYYRVSSFSGNTQSGYTDAAPFPVYTACDYPSAPIVTGIDSTSIAVQLVTESPTPNATGTTYAIYCASTSQYIQANGTLGADPVWQSLSTWGTVTITGLTPGLGYCFISEAMNGNGDIRTSTTKVITETFDASGSVAINEAFSTDTNVWWCPSETTSGTAFSWKSTGGCSGGTGGGNVGFTGADNNYFGDFIRTPLWSCTGDSSIVMTFDLSNSYIASHQQPSLSNSDRLRFYMWVSVQAMPAGTYVFASSVKIDGIEVGENDENGESLRFDTARTCVPVSVTFNLDTVTDKSAIFFYIEADCEYNDAYAYSVGFDNISLPESVGPACITTSGCTGATIQSGPVNRSVCAFNNAAFGISAAGRVRGYQWQYSANRGNTWDAVSNDSIYTSVTTDTLNIIGARGWMNGYEYRCVVTDSCGNQYNSAAAVLTVDSFALPINVILNGDTFSVNLNGDTVFVSGFISFQWYYNGLPASFGGLSYFIADSTGTYAVQITDSSGCSFFSDTVNIYTLTGIRALTETRVDVYPNPLSSGNWRLAVDNNMLGSTVRLEDAEGRSVWISEIKSLQSEIPVDLAPGIYILTIYSQGRSMAVKKLVKINP